MICKILGHKLFEIRTQEQVHAQMFSVLACQRCGVAKAIASPERPILEAEGASMKFAGQSLSQLIAEQAHGRKVPLPQSGTLSVKCLHSEHSRCYKLSCGCKCHES